MKILKGQVYYASLSPTIGSEQGGTRPVVIVQNNAGNMWSPTTIVAPLTNDKNPKRDLPIHVKICKDSGLRYDSIALLEQIRVIDKQRLGAYVTQLDVKKIDEAMLISLGITNKEGK